MKKLFDEMEISFNQRKEDVFAFSIYLKEFNENKEKIGELLTIALEQYS
jgi:hypothetical protein